MPQPSPKPVTWLVDTLAVLRACPQDVQDEVGYALYLAQNEKDADLRRAAIEKLGLMGSQKTAETLVGMYANEKDCFVCHNTACKVELHRIKSIEREPRSEPATRT